MGKTNQGGCRPMMARSYIADAALFVKATQPQLGIEDPYQLTETQYNAVLESPARPATADPSLLARRHRTDERLQKRR